LCIAPVFTPPQIVCVRDTKVTNFSDYLLPESQLLKRFWDVEKLGLF
jgi:hypothetical protein